MNRILFIMKSLLKIVLAISIVLLIPALQKPAFAGEDIIMSKEELLEKADSLFNSRQYAESRRIYKQIAEKAENAKDNSLLTEAYSMIAQTFLILDKKEIGREWITKARNIANYEEPLGWSRYLGVRGRFEWKDDELDKAAKTFIEMYEFCSAQKFHERAIDAAHMVAIVSDLEEQVTWAKKGIVEAEAGNVTRWLGPLWNNLAATYEDMGKFKDAVESYLNARDYHYKYGDETNKMIADWAVGHAYRLNGDIQKAEKWMFPVLDWSTKLNNTEFIGWANNELGEIELTKENYQLALDYFAKASRKLQEADIKYWDPDGFQKHLDKIKMVKQKLSDATK